MPLSAKDQALITRLLQSNLLDDNYAMVFFHDFLEGISYVLTTVLKRKITLTESVVQKTVPDALHHYARFDIWAKDQEGNIYIIEIQNDLSSDTLTFRIRFYLAIADTEVKKGDPKYHLPEVTLIMFSKEDPYGMGLPLYHGENVIIESGLEMRRMNDGRHIIVVNCSYQNTNSAIGRLIHDFNCRNTEEMLVPLLKKRAKYIKESAEGRNNFMTQSEEIREEGRQEGRQEGRKEGLQQGKRDEQQRSISILVQLAEDGKMSYETLHDTLRKQYGFSEETIEEYLKSSKS